MKNFILATTIAILAAASVASVAHSATIILQNDFSTVTPGTYAGISGASFGPGLLGNASTDLNTTVSGTGGVGGGRGVQRSDPGGSILQRSVNSFAFTDLTSFSFYVKKGEDTYPGTGIAGGGWGVGNPTTGVSGGGLDGANLYAGAGTDYRLLVGLVGIGSDGIQLGWFVKTNIPNGSGVFSAGSGDQVTFTGIDYNWYKVSFGLQYSGTTAATWTVSNMLVENYGADGLTLSGTVAKLATATFDPGTGAGNLESATGSKAWAIFGGRAAADFGTYVAMDNLVVTAVPEPSAAVLLVGGLGVCALVRRRRGTGRG